jgi:hypothetical protein
LIHLQGHIWIGAYFHITLPLDCSDWRNAGECDGAELRNGQETRDMATTATTTNSNATTTASNNTSAAAAAAPPPTPYHIQHNVTLRNPSVALQSRCRHQLRWFLGKNGFDS